MSHTTETSADVRMRTMGRTQRDEEAETSRGAIAHGWDVRDLPNRPVEYTPRAPRLGGPCPWPADQMKECYTRVAPLLTQTPHRAQSAKASMYDPTISDVVAYVRPSSMFLRARRQRFGGIPADRYVYSFLTHAVVDTYAFKETRVEDFHTCTLPHVYDAIGGDPAGHRVTIEDLGLPEMDVRDRLRAIYTHLVVRDPDQRERVTFSNHLSTAVLGLRPQEAFWGKRGTSTIWLDPGCSTVYTLHPEDPTALMATDSGDALIQAYYQCRGLYVTGTRHTAEGLVPDYRQIAPAPVFAVTRWNHEAPYPGEGDHARSYLWYLRFWHTTPTTPTKLARPLVERGEALARERGMYSHPDQTDARTEGQLAWYCAHLCYFGHFDKTRLLPARYVEYYPESEIGTHAFGYGEIEECQGKLPEVGKYLMAQRVREPTEWAWYQGGRYPDVGVNRALFCPEK